MAEGKKINYYYSRTNTYISEETGRNLVSNLYLHNNPKNFESVANYFIADNTSDFYSWEDNLLGELRTLIRDCESREKLFYSEFNVSGREEFEQQELLGGSYPFKLGLLENEKKSPTINNIIGHIINSQKFASKYEIDFKKSLSSAIKEYLNIKSDEVIDSLMSNEEGGFSLSVTLNKVFDNIQKITGQTNRGKVEEDFRAFLTRTIKNRITNEKGVSYPYLKKQLEKVGITPKIYLDRYKKEINKSLDASSLASKSGITGYVLEISFPIVKGDAWENQGNETQQGQKVPSDMIVRTASGKEFLFQLKNSFNNQGNFVISNEMKYQTLSERIGKYSPTIQDLLDYLVGNLATYNKTKSGNLTLSNKKEISEYIKYILNAILVIYLSNDVKELGLNTRAGLKNDFLIYKGEYLIPMSSFFKNAESLITKGLKTRENRFGAITSMPKIEEAENNSIDLNILRMDKREKISTLPPVGPNGEYTYPKNLLIEGKGKARQVAYGLKIGNMQYHMTMRTLVERLRQFD